MNAVRYLHYGVVRYDSAGTAERERERNAALTDPRESDTADGIRQHIGEY